MGAEARYWAIVDLETTGVDPIRHEIVQLARVVIDTVEQEIIPRLTFVAYIKPTRWRNREREAMEVNRLALAMRPYSPASHILPRLHLRHP